MKVIALNRYMVCGVLFIASCLHAGDSSRYISISDPSRLIEPANTFSCALPAMTVWGTVGAGIGAKLNGRFGAVVGGFVGAQCAYNYCSGEQAKLVARAVRELQQQNGAQGEQLYSLRKRVNSSGDRSGRVALYPAGGHIGHYKIIQNPVSDSSKSVLSWDQSQELNDMGGMRPVDMQPQV